MTANKNTESPRAEESQKMNTGGGSHQGVDQRSGQTVDRTMMKKGSPTSQTGSDDLDMENNAMAEDETEIEEKEAGEAMSAGVRKGNQSSSNKSV